MAVQVKGFEQTILPTTPSLLRLLSLTSCNTINTTHSSGMNCHYLRVSDLVFQKLWHRQVTGRWLSFQKGTQLYGSIIRSGASRDRSREITTVPWRLQKTR